MSHSRKTDVQEIGHLIGNAAAHVALYPHQHKRVLEALLYFGQAEKVAAKRTWNEKEIERCRDIAYRRAASETRRRLPPNREREYDELVAKAQQEIDAFINEQMVR